MSLRTRVRAGNFSTEPLTHVRSMGWMRAHTDHDTVMAIGQPLTSVSESHLPAKAPSLTQTKRRKEGCSASQAHKRITTQKKSMATRCPRRSTAQPRATHPQIHCAHCATTWSCRPNPKAESGSPEKKQNQLSDSTARLCWRQVGVAITSAAGGGAVAAAVCD